MVDGIICISGIEEIPSHFLSRDIPIVCIDRKPKDHSEAIMLNLITIPVVIKQLKS